MDGMWRIDHADQDDDDIYITSIGRAVDVREAYPFDSADSDSDYDSYHFFFDKNAIGRAQVKVFATCLRKQTEQAGGHSHNIVVTIHPTSVGNPGGAHATGNTFCPTNEFVAQTGYKVTPSGSDPVPFNQHVQESWMTANMRGWTWYTDLSQDPGSTIDYYASCVRKKLPASGGEKHKLIFRYQGPESHSLAAKKVSTKRISCASHYKAIVAGFTLNPPVTTMADPNTDDWPGLFVPKYWWLGMDPQPKSRDFRFLNSDTAASPAGTPSLAAICLNYRTT
jgi:hypothetical protein